jgi:putative toxin-antitoxin system antitoxin component (TIGR02293 family)
MDLLGNDASLAIGVEEGIPVSQVIAFGRSFGFTSDELAGFMRIHPRTYARRRTGRGRLKIAEGERAVRLMRLSLCAKQALGTKDLARRWLKCPLPVLNHRTPFETARTEWGAREVEAVLGRIQCPIRAGSPT